MGEHLLPLDVPRIEDALRSFPTESGLGWDCFHLRAWLRLGITALTSLVLFFTLVEKAGRWPLAIGHVMIALLAKATGGFRPIGLFPSLVRIWMRARLPDATAWQALWNRPWLYAGPGRGADVAAWKQAARAESAAAFGLDYAAALLDLVKAFERVPHDLLVRRASSLRYNLYLLRVSTSAYLLARTVQVRGVCAKPVFAIRGITAGSGHATIELRVLLARMWD